MKNREKRVVGVKCAKCGRCLVTKDVKVAKICPSCKTHFYDASGRYVEQKA